MRVSQEIVIPRDLDRGRRAPRALAQAAGPGRSRHPLAARLAELRGRIESLPDVREERVAHLRTALALGSYRVEPGQVAEAILRAMTRPR